jgi:hypothetical protein
MMKSAKNWRRQNATNGITVRGDGAVAGALTGFS